jgi:uncharacterized membrane protein YfcA
MGGSMYGYREHLATVRPWLWRFVPVSIAGGLIGSILLTRTKDEVFANMVPFLLLFAAILFMAQGAFRKFAGIESGEACLPKHHAIFGAIAFQLAVAIYGGYFGAGIGILMLASLGFIGFSDIHQMNSLKTVLASLINIVATAWFVYSGLINWPKAAIMTAGALAGYYLGANFALRLPQQHVRKVITAIGFGITAVMFYKQFFGR